MIKVYCFFCPNPRNLGRFSQLRSIEKRGPKEAKANLSLRLTLEGKSDRLFQRAKRACGGTLKRGGDGRAINATADNTRVAPPAQAAQDLRQRKTIATS